MLVGILRIRLLRLRREPCCKRISAKPVKRLALAYVLVLKKA